MKRRSFLKSIPYAVLPSVVGGYSIQAFGSNPFLEALSAAYTDTDKVLVLVQLSGGNDGLNMILPLDQYSGMSVVRSNILIPENKTLVLPDNPNTALHPAMTGLFDLYKDGKVNVVQGVSYPKPDFSHFRATDIWMSASDSKQYLTTGWAGRYLMNEFPNFPTGYPNATMPDPLAIQIGGSVSSVFQGVATSMGMAVQNTSNTYTAISALQDPAPNDYYGKEITHTRTVMYQTQKFYAAVKAASDKITIQGTYPNSSLSNQLKIVARLIAGGLKTRIYMVSLGGFDTHSIQVNPTDTTIGAHANLLSTLSQGIKAFMDDCKGLKIDDRVIGMTFSEFGRRIKSNASGGTDHGSAAPVIMFGNGIKGGVTGTNPTITATMTSNDNIPMQYDFRSLYSSIMENWFCLPSDEVDGVLLKNFQRLPLINNICSRNENVANEYKKAGIEIVSNYPNPFTDRTTIKYTTEGGYTLLQIFNNQGVLIKTLVNEMAQTAGTFEISCDLEGLPTGIYYARFENDINQQVRMLSKVQ